MTKILRKIQSLGARSSVRHDRNDLCLNKAWRNATRTTKSPTTHRLLESALKEWYVSKFSSLLVTVLYVKTVRQIFKFFVRQVCADYSLLLSVLIVCRIPSPWSEVDSEGEPWWFPWSSSVLQMRRPDPEMTKGLKRAVSRLCYFSRLVRKDIETLPKITRQLFTSGISGNFH